ncbi:pullulanase [Streptococcus danieliae]|uniref:pullulanase n=1 Tax=Streptococcus danieliae TaxID=747656 RepID=UPI0021C7993D|nr:pullulanase [Streptococcus danieliae]MCU0082240.1 pullulanase [Streptococcus danieliae]
MRPVISLKSAKQISDQELILYLAEPSDLNLDRLSTEVQVWDTAGERLELECVEWLQEGRSLRIQAPLATNAAAPYRVQVGDSQVTSFLAWQLLDQLSAYEGPLGLEVGAGARQVQFRFWAPSAQQVELVLYDKKDADLELAILPMKSISQGIWFLELEAEVDLGLPNLQGYFYHYQIQRADRMVRVLDPYAPSLATWSSQQRHRGLAYQVAKGAILDPRKTGRGDLAFAEIPGYKKREDAVIYEVHVRDFTSDPEVLDELAAPFGTFQAMEERLDYIQSLGVTHIQLLPVLSYYLADEFQAGQGLWDYASGGTNYNWGYDPQHYFALTGMYSVDPADPGLRIQELKDLIAAIHARGMGVILDVVYNHTAQLGIFEDLEPHYYHFMDADGEARTSFGGGRLASTHTMTRRLMLDSIAYLLDVYKVDGFRFDMMGDHDAETLDQVAQLAREINPQALILGEGWRTYVGDEDDSRLAADQDWMDQTDQVAVFSDHFRNSLKSGYPTEGEPAFLTGGAIKIHDLFQSLKAQPTNFKADQPGDVVQYIEAHDNLPLFDIIAQSIQKDPEVPAHLAEIHRRIRLGQLLLLTAQGTVFLHAGQEYGRTKQFRHPDFEKPVAPALAPHKSYLLEDQAGQPFRFPYFIHDSYDASDAVNRFDWSKVRDAASHPDALKTLAYTRGLIVLRKAEGVFRLSDRKQVDQKVQLLTPGNREDLLIAYRFLLNPAESLVVVVNADDQQRSLSLAHLADASSIQILVDGEQVHLAGIPAAQQAGFRIQGTELILQALTGVVLKIRL